MTLTLEALEVMLSTQTDWIQAVDALSLTLAQGQTFALVGESGCGKSMTALAMMRLLPDNGRIIRGDLKLPARAAHAGSNQDSAYRSDHSATSSIFALSENAMCDIRGRRISMIFQEPSTSLNPVLRVGDQIGEVLRRHTDLGSSAIRRSVIDWLGRVGLPEPQRRVDDYPFQFSGGQKQRIMIAMALIAAPDVLIADEPTTALDVTLQQQIMNLLAELQRELGMSMLLITHDLALMAQYAQQVALMYAGQLVALAPVAQFLQSPEHPYAKQLLAALPDGRHRGQALAAITGSVPALNQVFSGCRFAPRCAQAVVRCSEVVPPLTSLENRQVRCLQWSEPAAFAASTTLTAQHDPLPTANAAPAFLINPAGDAGTETVLQLTDVKIHFPIRQGILQRTVGWVPAVDGVSLTVSAGQTVALVGESGCGKTTLARGILQLLRGQVRVQGDIVLLGQSLLTLQGGALRRARRNIQIVFQDPFASLNPRLRIDELMAEGMQSLLPQLPPATVRTRSLQLLERVGLSQTALHRYPHEFSGGQRQRIAIARALSVDPKVIIYDEPTSALDVSVQAQILNLLRTLQQETGMGYLLITHNFAVVDYCADAIAVMQNGHIVEQGPARQVLDKPAHAYTRKLLAAVPTLAKISA